MSYFEEVMFLLNLIQQQTFILVAWSQTEHKVPHIKIMSASYFAKKGVENDFFKTLNINKKSIIILALHDC